MLAETKTEQEIKKLTEEFKSYRWKTEDRFEKIEKRINGIWWKMGIFAGILSILIGQVFGTGVVAAATSIMSGLGL